MVIMKYLIFEFHKLFDSQANMPIWTYNDRKPYILPTTIGTSSIILRKYKVIEFITLNAILFYQVRILIYMAV